MKTQRIVRGLPVVFLWTLSACQPDEKPTAVVNNRPTPPPAKSTAQPLPPASMPADQLPAGHANVALPPGHPPIDSMQSDTAKPESPAAPNPNATPGVLSAAGVSFKVSTDWTSETPKTGMRLAQYKLSGPGGPAELILYCFGKGQGGDARSNVNRWCTQFSDPQKPGEPVKADTATFDQAGMKVTVVKVSGTYAGMNMGPASGGQPAAEPNQAMFAAIIEGAPNGNVFIKATGPASTIQSQTAALDKMLHSLQRAD